MANYNTLISAIQAVVRQNGNNEITGDLLQQTLLAMISSLGAGYQFVGVAQPSTNPGTPDQKVFYIAGNGTYPNFGPTTVPDGYLGIFTYDTGWHYQVLEFPIGDGSITTAKLADGAVTDVKLAASLLAKLYSTGYKYAGVAHPSTNPGTPNQNIFYIAGEAGTYTNFANIVVPDGELAILKYNGSWQKEDTGGATQEAVNGILTSIANIITDIGDLSLLQTTDKSSLVAAINEAAESAGEVGSLIAFITQDIFAIVDESLNIGMSVDSMGVHAQNILEYQIINA